MINGEGGTDLPPNDALLGPFDLLLVEGDSIPAPLKVATFVGKLVSRTSLFVDSGIAEFQNNLLRFLSAQDL